MEVTLESIFEEWVCIHWEKGRKEGKEERRARGRARAKIYTYEVACLKDMNEVKFM